jgi:hypothetical protein
MNPPSGRQTPHLDPGEASKGQDREVERAASEWRSVRAAARKAVAGRARNAEDFVFLLEALDLHPDTDGRAEEAGFLVDPDEYGISDLNQE